MYSNRKNSTTTGNTAYSSRDILLPPKRSRQDKASKVKRSRKVCESCNGIRCHLTTSHSIHQVVITSVCVHGFQAMVDSHIPVVVCEHVFGGDTRRWWNTASPTVNCSNKFQTNQCACVALPRSAVIDLIFSVPPLRLSFLSFGHHHSTVFPGKRGDIPCDR